MSGPNWYDVLSSTQRKPRTIRVSAWHMGARVVLVTLKFCSLSPPEAFPSKTLVMKW
jgi:hypothetical protein